MMSLRIIQDTLLFYGTVGENITFGKEGATKEDIIRSAKEAGANDFIESLPNSYDTIVGENPEKARNAAHDHLTFVKEAIIEQSKDSTRQERAMRRSGV